MKVLVLGGYGLFGAHISRKLAEDGGFEVIVAGRNVASAAQLIAICGAAASRMQAAAINTTSRDFVARLQALAPDIIIDAAGPFQARDLHVPRAALAVGAHCIDLADGRDYVQRIPSLDADARAANRLIVSGASSVPGLSAAVVAKFKPRFSRLRSVEAGISPGNRTPRGLATTEAILGYVGQPYSLRLNGRWQQVHGWQSLQKVVFEGVGARWFARCEVPDLDVLPARWPELERCDFRAGLELHRMHFGLWLVSWAVRVGVLRSLRPYARLLLNISSHWLDAGSDTGVMYLDMRGTGQDGAPLAVRWELIAQHGDGPHIPATAAVVLARKLAAGNVSATGARACLDLFTLDDYLEALGPLSIQSRWRELPH